MQDRASPVDPERPAVPLPKSLSAPTLTVLKRNPWCVPPPLSAASGYAVRADHYPLSRRQLVDRVLDRDDSRAELLPRDASAADAQLAQRDAPAATIARDVAF